jgi:hypothetical protein
MFNIDKSKYTKIIFFGVFLISLIFFTLRWNKFTIIDSSMWANQAQYVLEGDSREFDYLNAYGHPGGLIIEGTIVLNKLFNLTYLQSVIIFIILINSIFVAGICTLCFKLGKDKLWWVAVLVTLIFNWLYSSGTPTSIVATLSVSFLCLLTLYLYEKKLENQNSFLIIWGIVAGISIATRIDIGLISFIVFLFILSRKIDFKKIILLALGSFVSFILFNPFMWFMPIQHVRDLIFKFVFHYSNFITNHLSLLSILSISSITFISILLSLFYILSKRKINFTLISPFFLWTLIGMTSVLYFIFLTSRFQAERYFTPILIIWEIFFPLFIFFLIDKTGYKSNKTIKICFIIFLVIFHISLLTQNIWTCISPCLS